MERILMILEVSRKQKYIFSSRKLRENAARSAEIAYVTGSDFFREYAADLYQEEEHLVYSGGGHTVLQFPSQAVAKAFAQRVTEAALNRYDGMELFVKIRPYDTKLTPGENLAELSAALEKKKALRKSCFRYTNFGVELRETKGHGTVPAGHSGPAAPEGWTYPNQFKTSVNSDDDNGRIYVNEDNFIAVTHIDGNAMGKRVEQLYLRYAEKGEAAWQNCRDSLQRFSRGIQTDFEAAFAEMTDIVLRRCPGLVGPVLPLRPVILAGDDVCFVSTGRLGLACARIFLERLSMKRNVEDGQRYAACAGVALVHSNFPFRRAYGLAEELCANAKRYGVELDNESRVSAMDWHIEFGELRDNLSELRQEYETEDGCRLELRPVVVTAPDGVNLDKTGGVRTYRFISTLCQNIQQRRDKIARSKLKVFRTALKQGRAESQFFLVDREIGDLLNYGSAPEGRTEPAQTGRRYGGQDDLQPRKEVFIKVDGVERCLVFDAIELYDHWTQIEEESQ